MDRMDIAFLTREPSHESTVSADGQEKNLGILGNDSVGCALSSPVASIQSSPLAVVSGLTLLASTSVSCSAAVHINTPGGSTMPKATRAKSIRTKARTKTKPTAKSKATILQTQTDFTPNRTVDASTRGAKQLSPLQDDHKKRLSIGTPGGSKLLLTVPRIQRYNTRSVLKNRLNDQLLVNSPLPSRLVAKVLEKIYEEVENDDREMYRLDRHVLKEQTKCSRSDLVETLDSGEFVRMLTYGEVSVASMTSTVLPLLDLQSDDVFYDLGCGTGKIVVQAALETPCCVAKGIELMQNRVQEGERALQRLQLKYAEYTGDKVISIVQGDILRPPQEADIRDATVVFINNVCFGPELMFQLMRMMSDMKTIRRVVTLRKICERHRHEKCLRAGSCCVNFKHPPLQQQINVSWADKTSVYLYERLEDSPEQLPWGSEQPQQNEHEEEQQTTRLRADLQKQQEQRIKERAAQERTSVSDHPVSY